MKSNNNVDFYLSDMVGGNKIEIFVEKLPSKENVDRYEFLFKLNGSTTKQLSLSIPDLYKVFVVVQRSLLNYIQSNIVSCLTEDKQVQLMIEAEGNTQQEVAYKDNLYNYHLERLSKMLTKQPNDVVCTHTVVNKSHFLNFSVATSC